MDLYWALRTANEVRYSEGGSDNYWSDVDRILKDAAIYQQLPLENLIEILDRLDQETVLGTCLRWLADESEYPKTLLRHLFESYLFHVSAEVRKRAAEALSCLNDIQAIRALEIVLLWEKNTWVQTSIIETIYALEDVDDILYKFIDERAKLLRDILQQKQHIKLKEALLRWRKSTQWSWSKTDRPPLEVRKVLVLLPPLQEDDPGSKRPIITNNLIIYRLFNNYHFGFGEKSQPDSLDTIYQAMVSNN